MPTYHHTAKGYRIPPQTAKNTVNNKNAKKDKQRLTGLFGSITRICLGAVGVEVRHWKFIHGMKGKS